MLKRFKLLAGTHVDDGKVYREGDILESPHDLDLDFRCKFQRLDTVQKVARAVGEQVGGPKVRRPDLEAAEAEQQQAHSDPEIDLSEKPAPKPAKAPEPKGIDVTKKFPKAVEEDCLVFKDGGKFFVYDKADPSEPLNAEGADRDSVAGVIDHFLARK